MGKSRGIVGFLAGRIADSVLPQGSAHAYRRPGSGSGNDGDWHAGYWHPGYWHAGYWHAGSARLHREWVISVADTMTFRESVQWTREVFTQWRHWIRTHWRITLALSALAFVAAWAWNTYAMAVGLEGSAAPEGSRTPATADGHAHNALFWLILFTLISGVATYAWTRGWTAFRTDVASFPRRFTEALTTNRAGASAMLLWGTAVALVIATLISSAVSIMLGLALLALASSPFGVILSFALVRMWRGLCGIVAKKTGPRLDTMINPFMVMLGEGTGLLLDGVIGNWVFKLLFGVGCAVVSVALARGSPGPRTAAILISAGLVVTAQMVHVRGAWADDGGWSECVTPDGRPCTELDFFAGVLAWFRSDGAGHVLARGSIGAIAAAVGVLIGLGVGAAAASLARSTTGTRPRPRHAAADDQPWQFGYRSRGVRFDSPFDKSSPGRPPTEPPERRVPDPGVRPDQRIGPPRPVPEPQPEPPRPVPDPHPEPSRPLPDPELEPPRPVPDPEPQPQDPAPDLEPQPIPEPDPGSGYHGTVYRSSGYEPHAPDEGQIYHSASAGDHVPNPGVPPVPHPSASGVGNPWTNLDDLDDFLPDAPEREEPRRGKRKRADDDPPDPWQNRRPGSPRPPTPPRRP
jgi:hypothetical protein